MTPAAVLRSGATGPQALRLADAIADRASRQGRARISATTAAIPSSSLKAGMTTETSPGSATRAHRFSLSSIPRTR